MDHKTIFDNDFKIMEADLKFDYQEALTGELDTYKSDFNQDILNEIVLWKINRYANFSPNVIKLINSISPNEQTLDIEKTKTVIRGLIKTKGVQLPMASTILRFRNPKLFQIIDQRVYRIIYPNQNLKINTYPSDKNIESQITIYLKYLSDLRKVCHKINIPFHKSDRILFNADKRINKNHKLNNY